MDLLVAFEILAPAEALPALETAVGLLSGVDAFVLLQVSCLAEAAAAHQAAVRLLPGVTPLMDPEVPDAAEGLPANLTGVMLFVVRAMMLTRPGESMQRRHCAPAGPRTASEHAEVRLDVHARADVLHGRLVSQTLSHGNHKRELLLLQLLFFVLLLETFGRLGFNVQA